VEEEELLVVLEYRRFDRRWEEVHWGRDSCSLVGLPYLEVVHREEDHSNPPVELVVEEHSSFDGSCGIAVLDTPFLR